MKVTRRRDVKNGALEDYLLDSVCRETVLHRGEEAPLQGSELSALLNVVSTGRRAR